MKKSRKTAAAGVEFDQSPFLYEIRVRGRLAAEQWTSWFDDLTVLRLGPVVGPSISSGCSPAVSAYCSWVASGTS